MTDRVTFRHGVTRPGAEQYSSDRFDLELVTDVREGETEEAAMERAEAFIMHYASRLVPAVAAPALRPVAAAPRRPPVQDELFDPSNPCHVRIAEAVLDAARVESEAKRAAKIRKVFPGERVGDLAAVLEEEEAAFRQSLPFRIAQRSGKDSPKSGWDGRRGRP